VTTETKPKFVPVDLTEMQDEGILLAANERFFWKLGLALTWDHDKETGKAGNLHIRQWEFEDGHRETIASNESDPVYAERRTRFGNWVAARVKLLPNDERIGAIQLQPPAPVDTLDAE